MSNLDEIYLLKNTLRALDKTHYLFRPLLSVYFIRKIVKICSPAEPSYRDLDSFMAYFRKEFEASFLSRKRLDISPFHPDKCRVIQHKCDFATRLFKRADEVLKSDLGILKLKDDVANFDHGEHAELRRELMKQGSSAQGSPAQGSSAQGSSAQGSSAQGSSAQGSSAQGSPAQGSSAQGGSSARKRQRDDTRKGLELLEAKIRGIKRRRERCTNEKIALFKKIDLLDEEIASATRS